MRSWPSLLIAASCVSLGACADMSGGADAHADARSFITLGQPAPSGAENALLSVDALHQLPADTLLVAGVPSLSGFADAIGWRELIASQPGFVRELAEEIERELGIPTLDPDALAALGVDPAAPAGFAWIGMDEPLLLVFAGVGDDRRFDATLASLAAREDATLSSEVLGGARVVWPAKNDPEVAIVRRDGVAWILASPDRGDVVGTARRIATLHAGASIAASPRFQQTLTRLGFGRDGGLYVDVGAIVANGTSVLRAEAIERRARLKDDLAGLRAQRETASGDEATSLDGDIDRAREMANDEMARLEGTISLLEGTFGGLTGVAAGVSAERGHVGFEAVVGLPEGTLLHQLGVNRGGPSRLARSLEVMPHLLLEGQVAPGVLRSLCALVASATGADLDRGLVMLGTAIGLDRDLFELLSGELGLALTAEEDSGERGPGFTATVGITDVEVGEGVLARLAAIAGIAEVARLDAETGILRIDVPGWRTVHLGIAGGAFVATSDPGAIDRLRNGGDRDALRASDHTAGRDMLENATTAAGAWMLDYRLFELAFRSPGHGGTGPTETVVPSDPPHVRGLRSELFRIDTRIHALEGAQRDRRNALGAELVRQLGTSILSARVEPEGLRLRGGQIFDADTLADHVVAVVAAGVALDREGERQDELQTLYEQRWKVQREADRLTGRDN